MAFKANMGMPGGTCNGAVREAVDGKTMSHAMKYWLQNFFAWSHVLQPRL